MATRKIRLVKCPKCLKILQEDEDVPVYQCGGCSTILQAKRRNIARVTEEAAQASEPETNNVPSSSGKDIVLPSSPERSSEQEYEKSKNASMESTEKEFGALDLSNRDERNEIKQQECSLGDSEKNEGEENSRLESDVMNKVVEAAGSKASSGSLRVDHEVAPRDNSRLESDAMNTMAKAAGSKASSGSLRVDHEVAPRESNSSGNGEISPDVSSLKTKQSQIDYPANKTSSAYDVSEREDQLLENEQWNVFKEVRSGKFEIPRYLGNYKEQGASSSSTASDKRRNGITANNEWYLNKSLQLEGPRGRFRGQRRRYLTEQLPPNLPSYPRVPYANVSPSYPSQDEFDCSSHSHSLQMRSYDEFNRYMFHNNTMARGRGKGGRFSGEIASERRNHSGYGSYSPSPQRLMEQPEYYPRWNHQMVSDSEDHHQRNHRELQIRRLKERKQPIAKRHVRPTAGGAPFISCYSCFQILQLPIDFLIFKRKQHLLRCGTCNTVLRFSLQSKTHLVPAVTKSINANRSSNSTSESPSKHEKPISSVQDEEIPMKRGSPLHRLMGYSTVSQVFKTSQRPPSL